MDRESSPIVEFITARLDDEEKIARAAERCTYGSWVAADSLILGLHDDPQDGRPSSTRIIETANYRYDDALVHAARQDPARTLREVEAKRKILNDLLPDIEGMDGTIEGEWNQNPGAADRLLELLALPFSDHPEYAALGI